MNETTITRQVMQNWQRQRGSLIWYHKIADPTFGGDVTNERAVDVVACYKGTFVGIEWKLKKDDRAFPLKRVRLGQVQTLCDIEAAGGVGLLAIAVYNGPYDKCVYMIPIQYWNNAVNAITDRKSIRIEEAFPHWKVEPRRVGSFVHWNLQPIEDLIHDSTRVRH